MVYLFWILNRQERANYERYLGDLASERDVLGFAEVVSSCMMCQKNGAVVSDTGISRIRQLRLIKTGIDLGRHYRCQFGYQPVF